MHHQALEHVDFLCSPEAARKTFALQWSVPLGSARGGSERDGLSPLHAELAQRGGGGRDAKDFAYALDELGVRRSIRLGTHFLHIDALGPRHRCAKSACPSGWNASLQAHQGHKQSLWHHAHHPRVAPTQHATVTSHRVRFRLVRNQEARSIAMQKSYERLLVSTKSQRVRVLDGAYLFLLSHQNLQVFFKFVSVSARLCYNFSLQRRRCNFVRL